jgi:hypothetical protein
MADEPSDELSSLGADLFPHLRTMDGNAGVDLEAQSHVRASNVEHRDLQQAMKPIGATDHNRLSILPR